MDSVGDGPGSAVVCPKAVDRAPNSKAAYVTAFILACGESWGLGGQTGETEGVRARWDGPDASLRYKAVFKAR